MSNRSLNIGLPKPRIVADLVKFIIVDSFCGAGGWTEGVERAVDRFGNRLAVVIAGINHDALAIASHALNHPETIHFVEDVRDKTLPKRILAVVQAARKLYPNAKLLFHGSLECTNFSNAKGGKSRDADSRSLAEFMPVYLKVLKPDLFTIENVREFMSWGPMIAKPSPKHTWEGHRAPVCHMVFDKEKKVWDYHWIPESRTKGQYYQSWLRQIQDMGYSFDSKLLNAADFGAYTSRLRYFGIFAKKNLRIVWPSPTHSKALKKPIKGQTTLFDNLKTWMPVRDVLDFSDEGHSIFGRKTNEALRKQDRKDLVEKSLERIYAGLIKHVAAGDDAFLSKYYSGKPEGKNISVDGPAGAMTTTDSHALVRAAFLSKYYGGKPESRNTSISEPCGTLTTENRCAFVQAEFLSNYYSKGGNTTSMDEPAATVTTKDRISLIQTEHFVDQQYGNSEPTSVDAPAGTLTANPKLNLIRAERFMANYYTGGGDTQDLNDPTTALTTNPHQRLISVESVEGFLHNPGWFGGNSDLDAPAPTIIARQDKAPVSVVQCEHFLLNNQHSNVPTSLDEPAPTLLTGNHHYLLNAQFDNMLRSVDEVAPTITADRHYPYLLVTESGDLAIAILSTDSPATVKIKQFMAAYGIVDIKMRMLNVPELKRIQGFPDSYLLKGPQTAQKKFIGNSVVPQVPQRMIEALAGALKGGVSV